MFGMVKTLDNLRINKRLSTNPIILKNDINVIKDIIHMLFTPVVDKNVYKFIKEESFS